MIPGIRHIEIQNFKSIERAVVDLAPLTVLVGPNGAGKSNFVESLAFLQQLVSTGVEQTFQYSLDIIPQWVRWGLAGGLDGEHLLGLRLELDLPDGLRAEYAVEL